MIRLPFALLAIFLVMPGRAPARLFAAPAAETTSVVAAEYAFARAAAATTVRAAFLHYLAPDAVVCTPMPVRGVQFYTSQRANGDRLEWYPALSATAGSGDLGYTSGPWTYRSADGKRQVHGTVLSIWRRQPGGAWRVELDCGISHPAPARLPPKLAAPGTAAPPWRVAPEFDPARWRESVAEVESRFSAAADNGGIEEAIRQFGAPELRAMLAGSAPADGLEAARTLLARSANAGLWQAAYATISRDGLIGYAWGYAGDASAARPAFAYVNVWRRASGSEPLKLVVTVIQKLPAQTAAR
jgi:ketosteroid isomerase-like protein